MLELIRVGVKFLTFNILLHDIDVPNWWILFSLNIFMTFIRPDGQLKSLFLIQRPRLNYKNSF